MNMISSHRSQRLIAKRYEEQGYVVTLDPPHSAFPFALGSYRPDILAVKGDQKIMIDVKSAAAKVDTEAYLRLDQEVQKHSGWRFLLVTVTEAELQDQTISITGSPNIERITEHLKKIDKIAGEPELAEMILPHLWTVYISALRLLALQDGLKAENYSDLSLLNQAYSTGMLSFDEYESAKQLLKIRNHAAHSLDTFDTTADWKQLRQMVDALLERLPVDSTALPLVNPA